MKHHCNRMPLGHQVALSVHILFETHDSHLREGSPVTVFQGP
jgi:hypothetical protein